MQVTQNAGACLRTKMGLQGVEIETWLLFFMDEEGFGDAGYWTCPTRHPAAAIFGSHSSPRPSHTKMYSRTQTKSLLIHSDKNHSLSSTQTHTRSRTHTHTDTIAVKPQRRQPEYSADDVRPALPRILLEAPSLSTPVSPLFPLALTCWQPVAMQHQDTMTTAVRRLHNWGITPPDTPTLRVWSQDGFGYCTGLWDNMANSCQRWWVLVQNKTREEKVPQRG